MRDFFIGSEGVAARGFYLVVLDLSRDMKQTLRTSHESYM
jgi:hypothetical protein